MDILYLHQDLRILNIALPDMVTLDSLQENIEALTGLHASIASGVGVVIEGETAQAKRARAVKMRRIDGIKASNGSGLGLGIDAVLQQVPLQALPPIHLVPSLAGHGHLHRDQAAVMTLQVVTTNLPRLQAVQAGVKLP